jgi:2-haloacid dehalogenase
VVFDVGHVLYDWDPRHLYRGLIADEAALDHFVTEIVSAEWHLQHDRGRPFAETSAELIARHPEHEALIRAYGPGFMAMIPGPMPGMPALVEELDRAGVPLYAITNFSHEWFAELRRQEAALFDRFRSILVSGEERLIKPDPAIYALALDRFGLAPGEGLFVDNLAENVAAGEAAGFPGHLFTAADRLRADLVARGLLG